jgi:hypothetical protein
MGNAKTTTPFQQFNTNVKEDTILKPLYIPIIQIMKLSLQDEIRTHNLNVDGCELHQKCK